MRSRLTAFASVFGLTLVALAGCASEEETKAGRFSDDVVDEDAKDRAPSPGTDKTSETSETSTEETETKETPETKGASPSNTCQTARDLGTIIGDDGEGAITAQGKCGEWIKVRVTETSGWATPNDLELSANLVSPTGADFDLFAYLNAEADTVVCDTPTMKSEKPSGNDQLLLEWGETWTGNSADDSRTVMFQVVSKSGKCADDTWTLMLRGNNGT